MSLEDWLIPLLISLSVFIIILAYFGWQDKQKRDKEIQRRLEKLEEKISKSSEDEK